MTGTIDKKALPSRKWSASEITILFNNFSERGVCGCSTLIPTRSLVAIQSMARDLGLKTRVRHSNDLLVGALKRLIEAVEEEGDTESEILEAKFILRRIGRAS